MERRDEGEALFTLAHCSDWHATSPRGAGVRALAGKRLLGWFSWTTRRSWNHREHVLRALFDDLKSCEPDHVAVTGDLTNISLEPEFEASARWLRELGNPSWVTVVPGNHDAYVRLDSRRTWDHWAPYMAGDRQPAAECRAPSRGDFPTVRIRGEVAIVGLCSARPTPLLSAAGRIGTSQLDRLQELLRDLRDRDLCRVVLVHHPPTVEGIKPRRQLEDAAALRDVLAKVGAELVLHGHVHRTRLGQIPGPVEEVPVVGVRSASDTGELEAKRAQYHLYEIRRAAPETGRRFDVQMRVRGFDRETGRFVDEGEERL